MRIDRSRIRVVRQLENGGTWDAIAGCVIAYGLLEVEVWPDDPIDRWWILGAWLDRRLESGSDDEREVLDLVERRILKDVSRLSAHQRIAMVRDGLLSSVLPRPGDKPMVLND